jgi:hypothetical protein
MQSWPRSVSRLVERGVLAAPVLAPVRWLFWFGMLIANTDMHAANLSFMERGARPLELAPAYDMSPAFYAPQQSDLVDREWTAPIPDPTAAGVWSEVCTAATEFWREVAVHDLVSNGFRKTALENAAKVAAMSGLERHLPQ